MVAQARHQAYLESPGVRGGTCSYRGRLLSVRHRGGRSCALQICGPQRGVLLLRTQAAEPSLQLTAHVLCVHRTLLRHPLP